LTTLLSALVPLALYIGIPSTLWNFDGVACAAALELGNPAYFFHANHLVYGLFGYLFWRWIGFPFGLARALPALQLFTSLAGSFGLMGLYRLLQSILKEGTSSLLLTLGLSVTAAFWVWNIEAQVYTLGFLALAWATFFLIAYEGKNKYIWVGLLHAGAVLGHLMHFLWVIPALFWMWRIPGAIRRYMTTFVLGTMIPYVLVLSLVIAPGRDLHRILIWLKGSVGLTPDRRWAWHSAGWTGPWLWLKSTLPALWGSFLPYGNTRVTPWMWPLTTLSIVIFLLLVAQSGAQSSDKAVRFSGLWLGTYGLFLSTWEPTTLCYRITDIIPLGILLAFGLRSWRWPYPILASCLFLGSTLASNASTQIIPMHQIEQNTVYQETLTLSKITPANSLYITEGGPLWIYLLYFTGREAWNARSLDPERLTEEIHRQKHYRPVYMLNGSQWQKVS
jgi:hypothetical protein